MNELPHTIFSKDVCQAMDRKIVPLVSYQGGHRRVIGKAILHATETGLTIDTVTSEAEIKQILDGEHR